jgi:heme exporter protein D
MNAWIILWTTVLLAALTLFACLAVAVTIGGFLDIRKMLRQVTRQHEMEERARAAGRRGG